jgi:hypothetical protein
VCRHEMLTMMCASTVLYLVRNYLRAAIPSACDVFCSPVQSWRTCSVAIAFTPLKTVRPRARLVAYHGRD